MTDSRTETAHPDQIRFLEAHGAAVWPAESRELLHGWQLGFTRGVTRRANSVLPLSWSGTTDLPAAILEAERRYRARNLQPCFKMTSAALPSDLASLLEARGYRREGDSLVLEAKTEDLAARYDNPTNVELLPQASDDWIAVTWPNSMPALHREVRLAMVGRIDPPPRFALAVRSGRACGGAFAVSDQGWVGITSVWTDPSHRRQGVARDLLAALAHWALTQKAGSLYLQVEADNLPAVALYQGAGFRFTYHYHYRVLASSSG